MSDLIKRIREGVVKAGITIGLVALVGVPTCSYCGADTIRTRVTDAQMTKVDGVYMIATEYGPLKNEDVWYRFKFNSGTVQNEAIRLKGKEVNIKKYGWRSPLFSMYENVTRLREAR